MKSCLGIVIVFALAFFAVPAIADQNAVKVAETAAYENYLTDSEGMTLYWFKNDSPGKSACYGGCVANWPVFYRETVAPTGGLKAEDFGTITRDDGKKQTTFRGYPLYYFAGDSKPGDMKGQGLKDVWFTVDPNKFPVK
ncbi:MAG: hypothetical protein P8Y77_06075 [Nitrospirota bacterium]